MLYFQLGSNKKVHTEFTSVALLGAAFRGIFTLEEEYIQEYVSLPASMFGKGTLFLLRAKGESMMEVCRLPYQQMKVLDMVFWQIDLIRI